MTANQSAYVLSFDLANPTSFTVVTSVPLNYNREQGWVPFAPTATFDALESDNWQRWQDTYTDPTTFGSAVNSTNQDFKTGINGTFVGAPQPILADIDFTAHGDIILGFMDRFAHQQGWANYITTSSTVIRSAVSQGDILLAYNTGTGYSFEGPNENDNMTTPAVAANAQAGQELNDGPSGVGEFFYKDYYIGSDATHPETALGGLGYVSGKQEVVAMMFDPNAFNSQGIRWVSDQTGNQTDYYTVIANTTTSNFGKGSALGDVEAFCNAAPIEIGNRVWVDRDKDGIQDAGEAGVDGVTVKLKLNGTTIATATTANGGQYYFTGVLADTTYTIVIETFATQTPLSNLTLTTANVGSNGSDLIDNDAVISTTSAVITYRTGLAGQNNHSLDFGFVCTPPTSTGITAVQATCTGSTANSDAAVNVTGISGMTKYSYGTNGTTGFFYATATASTATSISKTGLANPATATTYTFRIYGSDSTCYKDTSVVLNPKICTIACIAPTGGTVTATQATCNGAIANNDAAISITGIVGGDKYAYNTSGGVGLDYATATAFSGGTITITGLPNPSISTDYTIRVFNLANDCYVDVTATIDPKTCVAPCPHITLGPVPLPSGAVGQPYTAQITATGGVAPYEFYWYPGTTGSLPDGLSMDASGLVTGVPTTAGSYAIKVVCFDINNCADSLDPAILPIQCTYPIIGNITADTATCTNGVLNNDAAISLTGIVDGAYYAYGTNGTTDLFAATAATLSSSSINVTGLSSPATATTYTFRIYSIDTTCYNDTTVILTPSVCPPCTITATFTQGSCNNNGTTAVSTDDYFTVTVSGVSSTNGGTSGKYEVILNGTVLNTGGTAYGTSVIVGGILDFKSDGAATYNLTVRDADIPTCATPVFTTVTSNSCSVIGCKPIVCLPVTVTKL